MKIILVLPAVFLFGLSGLFAGAYLSGPDDYLQNRDLLKPGDTLLLEDGTYTRGLSLRGIHGESGRPIVIKAENDWGAVLEARTGANTMDIQDASHIVVEGLSFDGKGYPAIDAVKAGGSSGTAHHISIINNHIYGHGGSQQTVGISTKIPAWDWYIAYNIIEGAGTGLYLGNSNGSAPFIRGVIEFNLVMNTVGYCMQVKYQNDWPYLPGLPDGDAATLIRHNVFIKDDRPSPDGDRPSLLVGGQPFDGPGSNDRFEIYGNFFYHNPREYLFQGTGNISLHNNIFVDSEFGAINIRNHDKRHPKEIYVYKNTIFGTNNGIRLVSPDDEYNQIIEGNLVFCKYPITDIYEDNNIIGAEEDATMHVNNPSLALEEMDFYPKERITEWHIDMEPFADDIGRYNDFNGYPQDGWFFGAYYGKGLNPGWQPAAEIKTLSGPNNVRELYKDLSGDVTIYPNPAGDFVKVETNSKHFGLRSVAVIGLDGNILRNYPVRDNTSGVLLIPLVDLPQGAYIIMIRGKKSAGAIKLIKAD